MILAGVPVPDPRTWTPLGATDPVSITHAELVGLGAAIALRKEALFTIKKAREATLLGLTSAADIAAFDSDAGWS
jgi:hypothetical protein